MPRGGPHRSYHYRSTIAADQYRPVSLLWSRRSTFAWAAGEGGRLSNARL